MGRRGEEKPTGDFASSSPTGCYFGKYLVGADVSDPTSQNFKILYYNSLLSNSGDCPSGFKGRLEFQRQNETKRDSSGST